MNFKKLGIVALIVIVSIFAFAACGGKGADEGGEVVAVVNGENITVDQLDELFAIYLNSFEAQGHVFEGEEGDTEKEELRKQVLTEMIEAALIKQAAQKEGIIVGQEEIEAEYAELVATMGEENLKNVLEENFLTEANLMNMIEDQLLVEALFDHVTENLQATEDQLRTFYEENKMFLVTMQVSHILVSAFEGQVTEEEKQDAYEKAKEIIDALIAGSDFAELAKEHSEDPGTAQAGGKLEMYFTEFDSNLDPMFVAGAYQLDQGEFSKEPVESTFGYHIIRVDDKRDDFDDLRSDIERYVMYDERNAVFQQYMERLYEEAEIENLLYEA